MYVRTMLASALLALVGACAPLGGLSEGAPEPAPEAWRQTHANLPDGGPPVGADGLYNAIDSCPGEGCEVAAWQRFSEATPLREQPTRTANVVATIAAGEWVRAGRMVNRWRPSRGVVVGETQAAGQDEKRLNVGDVVYTVDYEGEGYVSLWRRGDYFSWYDPGGEGAVDGIRWDPRDEAQDAADEAAGAGWWVQVHREGGQTGWVIGRLLTCHARDLTDECAERNQGS